jgi:hypothetical protein
MPCGHLRSISAVSRRLHGHLVILWSLGLWKVHLSPAQAVSGCTHLGQGLGIMFRQSSTCFTLVMSSPTNAASSFMNFSLASDSSLALTS